MRRPLLVAVALLFLALLSAEVCRAAGEHKRPSRAHHVYFEGTADELNVYRVYGAQPGPTLMLIGGIQGDEPGGYLSADLYTDTALAKGDLIVVPRANLYSIILRHRGPDGDMNRQFGDPVTARRHKKIVAVLKGLMAKTNLLLNLHEGSGFFNPHYLDKMRNPMRFGQCIIADTDVYRRPDGTRLNLERMAERVLSRVNASIKQERYHFRFNNHRTSAKNSRHKEQRKSATYFALTSLHIPAFGVETSKSLPSVDMKVRHHALVINAFMNELGMVMENPGIYLAKPKFRYLVVSVNDRLPVVLKENATLVVNPGDRIKALHVEANYERGLTVDLMGLGSLNDMRRAITVTKSTVMVARKDGYRLGEVKVQVVPKSAEKTPGRLRAGHLYFLVDVAGRRQLVRDKERLSVVRGDVMTIVDVISNLKDQSRLKVNFKGFVPQGGPNRGEDRGFPVDTARDLLPRYSSCPGGKKQGRTCYRVVALQGNREVGEILVDISPARLQYLVLKRGKNRLVYLDGEKVEAKRGEFLKVVDIKTNSGYSRNLKVYLHCGHRKLPVAKGVIDTTAEPLKGLLKNGSGEIKLVVVRADQAIGHVRFALGGK